VYFWFDTVASESREETEAGSDSEGAPAAKKQRIDVCEFEDDDDVSSAVDTDEVTAYVQARVDASNRDILAWWKDNWHQFPKLATLARQVFVIPASSAAE